MISSIGAEGTNAFTSTEVTAYKNKIPSNEIDKWLMVEKERFSELVLRLFHTELETVYEEFNRGQDNDNRKQYTALTQALFPKHPYGTQTTIGTSDHLKNPSMKAIYAYFKRYYVPNNMAIILVGDLEFDETISKISSAFQEYKYTPLTHPKLPKETPILSPIKKTVYGPSAESVYLAYRTPGINDKNTPILELINYLLTNSSAGLIDLNLNSLQKVQSASSFFYSRKDYGVFGFHASPKQNQNLNEVTRLLLDQITLLQKGEFDDWLIQAVIKDLTRIRISEYESSKSVANKYLYSFAYEQDWESKLKNLKAIQKITKEEVVRFANNFFKNNYVIVKKEIGKDPDQVKVSKPKITPIPLNRDQSSSFSEQFNKLISPKITPQHIDYTTAISTKTINNGSLFNYIENNTNDLASLDFIFPVGKDHIKYLDIAFSYINYLGTSTLSNEELKKEFYKLGIEYSFRISNEKCYFTIFGLKQDLNKGIKLLFNSIKNLQADPIAYKKLIARIDKKRNDTKKNKSAILWKGLVSYSKYGEASRLRTKTPIEELKNIDPEKLVSLFKNILTYQPSFFYYGNQSKKIIKSITSLYPETKFIDPPKKTVAFTPKETTETVYFINYDMVQAELVFISKSIPYNPQLSASALLFNTYFGRGLSSIVFQELRESKSLAYSAMSKYNTARKKEDFNYMLSYIGTQANKLPEAISGMKELLAKMPLNEAQFNNAKASVLKQISGNRITKTSIFWNYQKLLKLGITKDRRTQIYTEVEKLTLEDLNSFFNTYVKNKKFDLLVIGNKKDINIDQLKKFGTLKELETDYLFNF